jgi:hypothetical protein
LLIESISPTMKMAGMFLRNAGWNSTDYTASYPRWYSYVGLMGNYIDIYIFIHNFIFFWRKYVYTEGLLGFFG